ISRDCRRSVDADRVRIALCLYADNFAHGIDMAGDNMPAKLVPDFQGAFEIELAFFCPHGSGGFRYTLCRNIDREPVCALVHDRKARPGTGDGCADIDAVHVIMAGYGQPQVAAFLHFANGANIGNYACKHGKPFSKMRAKNSCREPRVISSEMEHFTTRKSRKIIN